MAACNKTKNNNLKVATLVLEIYNELFKQKSVCEVVG